MILPVILISLLASVTGIQLHPTVEGCHSGPEYWCKDASTAHECNVENFCQEKFLKHIEEKPSNHVEENYLKHAEEKSPKLTEESLSEHVKEDICRICNDRVKYVADNFFHQKGVTKRESLCQFMDTPKRRMCLKTMKRMKFQRVYEDLLKNARWGCQVFENQHMLFTATPNEFLSMPVLQQHFKKEFPELTDGKCQACEFIGFELSYLLKNNITQAELKADTVNLCNYMKGTPVALCKYFVLMYFDEIYEYLMKTLSVGQVCQALGLCAKFPV